MKMQVSLSACTINSLFNGGGYKTRLLHSLQERDQAVISLQYLKIDVAVQDG